MKKAKGMHLLLYLFKLIILTKGNDEKRANDLIDWLKSKNGSFYNNKIEIRRVNNDSLSRFGVFAKERIGKKELILSIPLEVSLRSDEEIENYNCGLVYKLIKEMKKGDDSEYAAYVNYLLEGSRGQLPSMWSADGKELLMKVLGDVSSREMFDLTDYWVRECNGRMDDFDLNAYMIVNQRCWERVGWDGLLIPVYDMISHRNGEFLNTEDNGIEYALLNEKSVKVRASRDILAGEEIYTSYNFCTECVNRREGYGTLDILSDYGFVEEYPQRWIFRFVEFDLDKVMNEVKVKFKSRPTSKGITMLENNFERLKNINIEMLHIQKENELKMIIRLKDTLMNALSYAVEDLKKNRYDTLEEKEDRLDYSGSVCESDIINFDYEEIDEVESHYQTAVFYMDEGNKDVCFTLDETYQICTSYRPNYHEMVVHYTARYLNEVKRVAWVGGGDSMLLHEILKYSTLELAVGLEIDQKVTRASFKHFGSQPHWDNPKVEWWYGDAAKSLLILPKHYFGSFDMVLVDLSESVTSTTVTDKLDVLNALSLLLKPDGIMVKNEVYFKEMSNIFQYTVQVHYLDVPFICSQALSLGSNGIDFMQKELKDHGIDNLFLKPLPEIKDKYEIWHDYKRNLTVQKYDIKQPEEQQNTQGVLLILEAENIDSNFIIDDSTFTIDSLVDSIESQGLNLVSLSEAGVTNENLIATITLDQGYVIARFWPQQKYCAFDIYLWGSFSLLPKIKNSLLHTLKASTSSSYRIVVGGMFGVPTWQDDEMSRGPQVTERVNQHISHPQSNANLHSSNILDIILEESLALIQETNIIAAVICPQETQPCSTFETLKSNSKFSKVIQLKDCSLSTFCERQTFDTFNDALIQNKLSFIILDPNASMQMARILLFILQSYKEKFISTQFLALAIIVSQTETWKRHWLERFRHDIFVYDPLFRAHVIFNASETNIEIGVTSAGDISFFKHFTQVSSNIQHRTGILSQITNITGGVAPLIPDYHATSFFSSSDYDQRPSFHQWNAQQPLGFQTVFQLQVKGLISPDQVEKACKSATNRINLVDNIDTFDNIADGLLIVLAMPYGNVAITWDGRKHIDVNLFTFKENIDFADQFIDKFKSHFNNMDIVLRDEQPRGCNRVVSFLKDLQDHSLPVWADP